MIAAMKAWTTSIGLEAIRFLLSVCFRRTSATGPSPAAQKGSAPRGLSAYFADFSRSRNGAFRLLEEK